MVASFRVAERERNPVERRIAWIAKHYPRTVVVDVIAVWAEAVGLHGLGLLLQQRADDPRVRVPASLGSALSDLEAALTKHPAMRTTVYETYLPWVAKILNERHKAVVRKLREIGRALGLTEPAMRRLAEIRDVGQALEQRPLPDVVLAIIRTNYFTMVDAMRAQFGTVARWAAETRTDIGPLTFDEATLAADGWLKERKFAKEKPSGIVVYEWPDGWTVRELLTEADLEYEGAAMGHCVDQYDVADLRKNVRLFSLRDPKNEPHATMEWILAHAPYSGNYVSQLRGKGNQHPPKTEYLLRMAEFRDQELATATPLDISSQIGKKDPRWKSSEFGGRFTVPGDQRVFELWAGHSILGIEDIDEAIADHLARQPALYRDPETGKVRRRRLDAAAVLEHFWPDDLLTVDWPPPSYEWWFARRGPDKGIAAGEDELAKALTEGDAHEMRPVFEALRRQPLGKSPLRMTAY